ncbi:bifunctional oligoribonuclease/PAP phosphatase NrnA [Actinomadura luteofluorescens]|uniref:DHH family phosphoesterase n=1 Tax=Actinomadura luteofluorescens TaxID=46163 RepID=UPI00362F8EA0
MSASGVPPESKPGGPFEAGVPSGLGPPSGFGPPPSRPELPEGSGGAHAELDWDRAVELIRGAREICLACHVVPDGDALGSMLALAQALRACGKRCLASFGEPFGVPAILRFLPGQEMLVERPDAARPGADDLAGRGGPGAARLARRRRRPGGVLIVIDHHASNTGFGGVRLVDPDAAATAVLVEELIRRLGVPLDRDIAQGLYAGLASDTGSFKYPSTTPEVHDLAGRLLTAGVRPETVSRELWDRAPFDYLQVLAGALARARLERDAAAAAAWSGRRSPARTGAACRTTSSKASSTSCAGPTRRRSPSCARRPTTAAGTSPPGPRATST